MVDTHIPFERRFASPSEERLRYSDYMSMFGSQESGTLRWNDTITLELSVFDSITTTTDEVQIQVSNVNQAPVLSGDTSVTADERETVQLEVVATDTDNDELGYIWTQISGESVSLTDTSSNVLEFTAPETDTSNELTFEVVVDDGTDTSVQTYIVTINNVDVANTAPELNVALSATSVEEGSDITLTITSSDAEGNALSIAANQTGGSQTLSLNGIPTSGDFNITAPDVSADESYTIEFTLSDGELSVSKTISFTVTNKAESTGGNNSGGGNAGGDSSSSDGGGMPIWLLPMLISVMWRKISKRA